MGLCGTDNCDSTWDALENNGIENIHEFSENELAGALERHGCLPMHAGWEDDHLGMVTWGLTHGKRVPEQELTTALSIAKRMTGDSNHLCTWLKPYDRIEALKSEIQSIEYALNNDGRGPTPPSAKVISAAFAKIRSRMIA